MRIFLMIIFSLITTTPVWGATITNKISGVGPANSMIYPIFCMKDGEALSFGNTSKNLKSGYIDGSLRFGGCSDANTYLGYLGLNVNTGSNKIASYSPPGSGVHIAYVNQAIDGHGTLTGNIQYTPINSNFNLLTSAPSTNPDWLFVGANLSGLEFGKVIDPFSVPNLSAEDAETNLSDVADTQKFIQAGMNTFRLPLDWGYLQLDGAGKGDINLAYYNSYVKPILETLTHAHVNVIVDLHAYMRYSQFGKQYAGCGASGACPDGTLITDANAYVDVWTKLVTLMKNNPAIDMNYILIDIVNEPVNVPNDDVFTIQTTVIKSLRSLGFKGYILVEGNSWTGLHSWTTYQWKSSDQKTTYTNATLFTRDNFAKAGITDLSNIVINVHQYFDSDYSGTKDQCLTDLTTVGDNGFNLNAFTDYLQQNQLKAMVTEFGAGTDQATCSVAMRAFLNYLKDNAAHGKNYGFIGWTIWSTGHGWGSYNLRVTPSSYHMQVLGSFLTPQ
jgi:endoglucanase